MITFFTTCKDFNGKDYIRQINALNSWKALRQEILVLGVSSGVSGVCERLDIRHLPEVGNTKFGRPSVRSLFKLAAAQAKNDIICYVNADILLTKSIIEITEVLKDYIVGEFACIGRRIDVNVREFIDFEHPGWEYKLNGDVHPPCGIDYFLLSKSLVPELEIPTFNIGVQGWDNWMVYTLNTTCTLVDVSQVVSVYHQNHPTAKVRDYSSPEAIYNLKLMENKERCIHNTRFVYVQGEGIQVRGK